MGVVASRADGIIANQPADGRVSLQELVQLEQPGFIEALLDVLPQRVRVRARRRVMRR